MLVLVFCCLALTSPGVSGESSCDHPESPLLSLCEGCPPTFNGLPCASTWYNDLTKVMRSYADRQVLSLILRELVDVALNPTHLTSGPKLRYAF